MKRTVPNTGHCRGRKTVLGARDKQALANNYCLLLARRGLPLKRQQLRSLLLQFCQQRQDSLVKSAEKTGMLGQHWLDRFLRRNSTVAIRKAESLSQAVGPVDKKYQNTAEEL